MAQQQQVGTSARSSEGGDRVRRQVRRGATSARGAALYGVDTVRRWAREPKGQRVYAVTVGKPRSEITAAGIQPLVKLREVADVDLKDAPGGRGTEIMARRRASGRPAGAEIRRLLRHAKQTAETGHVVHVAPQPHAGGPVAQRSTDMMDRLLSGGVQR